MQTMRKGSPNEVQSIVCDRCGAEAERSRTGFDQMLSIGFYAGRDSMFGNGSRVEIDLCQACLRATLGSWLRVQTPWEGGKMPPGGGFQVAGQSQTGADQGRGRFAHMYGVLTIEEMAARMQCAPGDVRKREAAGEIFATHTSGREGGPRYPAFQLIDRLSKVLLKKIILEYRRWDVSTTLMWSFLRTPQKIFGGLTVEMMLGGSTPGFDVLTPEEWTEAFLDVVSEELSRVSR